MKCSFVIPSYNCAAWLPHAVASALGQKIGGDPFPESDLEVIVVEDASTDSTRDYLAWAEGRFPQLRVIRNEVNQGRSESRNIGNRAAKGDVICVLDADDVAAPRRAISSWMRLHDMVGSDHVPNAFGLIYGSATVISPVGEKRGEIGAEPFNMDRALARRQNGIVHSTVAYRRDIAIRYPYRGGEIATLGIDDWAQQIEMAAAGVKFDLIPRSLGLYRQLKTGVSKTRDEAAVLMAKEAFLAEVGLVAVAA